MKALVLASVLAFSLSAVVLLQSTGLATANPMPFPPTPNTDPPVLMVLTPSNTTYYVKDWAVVPVNFSVTMPDSWGGLDPNGNWYTNRNSIAEINYILDGQKTVLDQLTTSYSPPTTPKVQIFLSL